MTNKPKKSKFKQLVRRVGKSVKRGLVEFGKGVERGASHYGKNLDRINRANQFDKAWVGMLGKDWDLKTRHIAAKNVWNESVDKAFTVPKVKK